MSGDAQDYPRTLKRRLRLLNIAIHELEAVAEQRRRRPSLSEIITAASPSGAPDTGQEGTHDRGARVLRFPPTRDE